MSQSPLALFRRLTSGVYVVGVAHAGRANAFTAAWLTQVSFDPLLVALAVHPDHASYSMLTGSGVFVVNVLAVGGLPLARQFGTRSGRETDKLAGVPWRAGPAGAPILADAAAHLECRVTESVAAGDHRLIIARVVGGEIHDAAATPLGYAETGDLDGSSRLYPPVFPPE